MSLESHNKFSSDCHYNGECDYRYYDKPEDTEKQRLINGLYRQIEIMETNAAYLYKLYPELNHHNELIGAAQITKNWLENIESTQIG